MSRKSKIDIIRNRAFEITEEREKAVVGVANLLAAILEDSEVICFIESKNRSVFPMQNSMARQIEQSASRRGNSAASPQMSEVVDEILEESLGHVKRCQDKSNEKDALLILAVLLSRVPCPAPIKVLLQHQIDLSAVTNYLNNFGIEFWDERFDLVDRSSSEQIYEPVISDSNNSTHLSRFTQCLNDLAHEGVLHPTVGRAEEVEQIIRILRQKRKNNPLLVGEAGVGKTAIVEGLAQLAYKGELSDDLVDKKFFQLNLNALIAGTKYRGEFEARIQGVLNELSLREDSVLFIDEMHTLMDYDGLADVLKPALARGELACVGATTFDEYRTTIAKNKALARRFEMVKINEPSVEDTHEILMGIRDSYQDHHGCIITSEAVSAAIDLSERYVTDRKLPDKAIELMDATGALMRELPKSEHVFDNTQGIPVMTSIVVAKALAKKTDLPLDKLTASDRDKILSLTDSLNKAVFGQSAAAEALSSAYRISRANLSDEDKPIGSFLMRGPTGVGKTEMTKQLAEELGMPLVRLDMSECMESHSVSKLIGAPPGYVGYNDGGSLTEQVHRNPHSVLLLDEIEKAHPDVFNILLQVMDHGELTDSSGKTVNFRNVILCMTSNVGEGGKAINSIGFGNQTPTNTKDGEFEKMFKPEFRNRLDADIRFSALTEKVMPEILEKVIGELELRLKKRKTTISLTPEAKDFLVTCGFDANMGARSLKRIFKQEVIEPIATKLLKEDFEAQGGDIIVAAKEGALSIDFHLGTSNDNRLLPDIVDRSPDLPVFLRWRR